MSSTTVRIAMPRRRWPLVIVGIVVALVVAFTLLSGFVIDVLWYDEIGQRGVFWTTLWTKVLLGVVFGAVFAGLLYANLVIARRIRPSTRVLTPEEEALERIRDIADPFMRWLLPLGALLLGIIVGVGASGRWQDFLLWRHSAGASFGNPDPLFGKDPAFYVFSLPWLRFVQGWLFSALVGITILAGVAHVLWGGIRPQAPAFADKVNPAARAHLSVLLGLIMLVKAWGYWIGRYTLLTSPRGVVEGASYTDVKAQLPALTLLTIVALLCALLFFVNIRFRQWSLPVISVALLGLVSILLGAAYPTFVQQVRVKPNEQQYEKPYIQRNIEATRRAFGLDAITSQERAVAGPLTAAQLRDNAPTVSNIRLWRSSILKQNFEAQQRIRQYYDFLDVDVDRYMIDGEPRVLMVSPREIAQNGIPSGGQTWQNRHLIYTHGFGAVAAQVNEASTEGQPVFTLNDLPPQGDPTMDQPRIYYGESTDADFVVVRSSAGELDYEGAPDSPEYNGKGGITMSNFFTRAMFAWRFRDFNLLVSGTIDQDSRILIYRDIRDRVSRAVPFLRFDGDPYFAIVDGRPMWIYDAYTTTDQYPYSQEINLADATSGLMPSQDVNYIRNSVKVVVDAYDGTVTYYADTTEPIVRVWSEVYPDLFTDITTAPADLQAHFRYPENLLQVQASQYANYHVTDADAFYQKRDFWQIPADPSSDPQVPQAMRPYYQLLRLPGASTESFQLVLPFVPENRPTMVAWLSASSDPGSYGDLTAYRFPEGRTIDGPSTVFAKINQDPTFSAQRSLLDQGGSNVLFGDFLVIPIDDSLLYVQPVYVQSESSPVPELKKVIVVNGSGGDVSVGSSLQQALDLATGGTTTPPDHGGNGGNGGGSVAERVARLLGEAQQHYDAAQLALAGGDLGTYQQEIETAQQLVDQAAALLAQGTGSPSPSPSPSVSGSPSPSASASPSP